MRVTWAGRSGLKIRYDDFQDRDARPNHCRAATQDARAIRRAAGECLKRAARRRIRAAGCAVGALCLAEAIDGSAPAFAAEPDLLVRLANAICVDPRSPTRDCG